VVAASGGDVEEPTPLDDFVEAMIDHDPGRALALVAAAVQQGREARLLADAMTAIGRGGDFACPQLPASPTAAVELLSQQCGLQAQDTLVGSSLG
ncbi:MAG: hypothetical protein ACLGHY_08310, partial [Gammaproteobacteria bacterium]